MSLIAEVSQLLRDFVFKNCIENNISIYANYERGWTWESLLTTSEGPKINIWRERYVGRVREREKSV